jgi:hypothetical protein
MVVISFRISKCYAKYYLERLYLFLLFLEESFLLAAKSVIVVKESVVAGIVLQIALAMIARPLLLILQIMAVILATLATMNSSLVEANKVGYLFYLYNWLKFCITQSRLFVKTSHKVCDFVGVLVVMFPTKNPDSEGSGNERWKVKGERNLVFLRFLITKKANNDYM